MMMETIRMMMVLTVLCGLIYPLAITGVARQPAR
jgi:K+-transporting ATPase c subunit